MRILFRFPTPLVYPDTEITARPRRYDYGPIIERSRPEPTPQESLIIAIVQRAVLDCDARDYKRPGSMAALEERIEDLTTAKEFLDSDDCSDLLELIGVGDEALQKIREYADALYGPSYDSLMGLKTGWLERYGERRSHLPCNVH